MCNACAHRLDDADAGDGETATCTSFPNGIPEDISMWGHDHRRSIAGEEPFELEPERQAEFDLWLESSPYSQE